LSRNHSASFLISQHSDAVWRMELCTGHFTLLSSLSDGWLGRLSPLGPHSPHPPM
jgi:hypothetical protein